MSADVHSKAPRRFVCVGAQKAGTTWLHDVFEQHPQILVPRELKEVNYWNTIRPPYYKRAIRRATLRRRSLSRAGFVRAALESGLDGALRQRREAAEYHALLSSTDPAHRAYLDFIDKGRNGEVVAGEICPGYAKLGREVFSEMARTMPDAKILFIIREPVARSWSGVVWNFRESLAKNRMAGPDEMYRHLLEKLADPDSYLNEFSDYTRTLREVEAVFGPEQVRVIFFENLFLQSEMDSVFDFLGVDRMPIEGGKKVNETKQARFSLSLPDEVAQDAAALLRPVYDGIVERFGEGVPAAWRRRFEVDAVDGAA